MGYPYRIKLSLYSPWEAFESQHKYFFKKLGEQNALDIAQTGSVWLAMGTLNQDRAIHCTISPRPPCRGGCDKAAL